MRIPILLILFISPFILQGQFPGAAGEEGSTAIFQGNSSLIHWATDCQVSRGWQDITDTSLGKASNGSKNSALGPADGNDVLSLGDGGQAVLSFDTVIGNRPGFDFVVFENALSDNFLELAFVEVSSDGINYVRFPASSLQDTSYQFGPFDQLSDPTLINNLAGKYRKGFGTPFDLEELVDSPNLDLNSITHVRVIDVIGSVDPAVGSMDAFGNLINDPFPTPFPPGGFDLDAVGIIGEPVISTGLKIVEEKQNVLIYPNPLKEGQSLQLNYPENAYLVLCDLSGKVLQKGSLQASRLKPGTYFIQGKINGKSTCDRLIIY